MYINTYISVKHRTKKGKTMQYKKDEPKITIPMFEVQSSNMKMIGYDPNSKTLRIVFKMQPVNYDYKGVWPELFAELMRSESKGKFFYTKIKGKFEFEKT